MTTAPHWFGSFDFVMLAGQVIVQGAVIVTVNWQLGPACDVHVTVVMPTGNIDPEAGEHVTTPQPPVNVGWA